VDIVLRVAFVYFAVMVALRVTGKRELGQMSPFDFVCLLLIPEIFSDALARGDYSMTSATVGAATLFSLVAVMSLTTFRWPRLDRIVNSEPTVLVHDGRFVERHLATERVTPADVFTEMHKAGLEELRDVRWAILEADGKISVVPVDPRGAATNPKQDESTLS
jgi:uncharacterized membrane protein YcaP (DUF421 family)